jgi:outer membrane protein assembly factor BamB
MPFLPGISFPCRPTLLAAALVFLTSGAARADDWPQWLGPQRDGIWRETGILDRFPSGGPKVLWRAPLGGGYSGPAVAGGCVYVTDRQLDPGSSNPDNPFQRKRVTGKERVLCLDEGTGKVKWKYEYPCTYAISYSAGPRATPLIHDGKVYALGAMGNLFCLDAKGGKVIWSKDFRRDYRAPIPTWGWAAHPLLDGEKLICLVGGKDSVVVAFDRSTGKELWRALSLENPRTEVGYCPPMIYKVGGKRQLIIWHPEAVNGLDPETGKVYWSEPFRADANLTISTPRLEGNKLFITSFYNGAMMLELASDEPAARVVWRGKVTSEDYHRTDTLNSIMCTPFLKDGYIYGVCSYGHLRCLRGKDGKRLWATLKATCTGNEPERWANAFIIAQGSRYFLPNEKGDLIIARLSPEGYQEIDRAHILAPTNKAMERPIVWSHPAFANRHMYARNDEEIVAVDLSKQR